MNLQDLPIEDIIPSTSNPRRHFDAVKTTELAASMREHGVLQPILVRLIPAAKPGRQTSSYVEIQVIENLQRDDLHPLEEAEGYERLINLHSYTALQIGERVGKSKSYINKRIQLLALAANARTAFLDDQFPFITALGLARIPKSEGQQQKALTEILTWGGGMGAREAAEHIHENYMLLLKDASFDARDATLVAAAGACSTCPKRAGNQRELFDDVQRADTCTDPACYKAKGEAHWIKTKAAAEAMGLKVLEGKAAENANYSAKFVRLHDRALSLDGDDGKSTWGKHLKKAIAAGDVTPITARTPRGDVIQVVPVNEARAALGQKEKPAADSYELGRKRAAEKTRVINDALAAAGVAKLAEWDLLNDPVFQSLESDETQFLRELVMGAASECKPDDIIRRRCWKRDIGYRADQIKSVVTQLSAQECLGVLFELLILRGNSWTNLATHRRGIWDLLGIDAKKVAGDAVAGLKATKAAKKSSTTSAKPKLKTQPGKKGGENNPALPTTPVRFICLGCGSERGAEGKCPACGETNTRMDAPKVATASPVKDRSEAITEAIASHYNWNEHGVCTNPEILECRGLPTGYKVQVSLAMTTIGNYVSGYDCRSNGRISKVSTGPAMQTGLAQDNRADAIGARIAAALRFLASDIKCPQSIIDAVQAWGKKLGAEAPKPVKLTPSALQAQVREQGPPFIYENGICVNPQRFPISNGSKWDIELHLAHSDGVWSSGFEVHAVGVEIFRPVRQLQASLLRSLAVEAAGEDLFKALRKCGAKGKLIMTVIAAVQKLRAGQ